MSSIILSRRVASRPNPCLEQRKEGPITSSSVIPIPHHPMRRRRLLLDAVVPGCSSSRGYNHASVEASTVLMNLPKSSTSPTPPPPPVEAAAPSGPAGGFSSRHHGVRECQGRRRARVHTRSIPADARSYVVAGQCEVQLSPDLVVGTSTYGNSQYCQMTIEFHDSDGKLCTYGEWKAEQEKKSMETTEPACQSHWSSMPEGREKEEHRHAHEENRVRLEANNLVLLGISAGRHHMMTVYQRLFSELPPSGYQSQML